MLTGVRTHSACKIDMFSDCFDYGLDNKRRAMAISGVTSFLFVSATRSNVSSTLDERCKNVQRLM